MRKTIFLLAVLLSLPAVAQKRIFHTGADKVDLILDGNKSDGGWRVAPQLNPDVLETTAERIGFVSDRDSLFIDNLKEWESFDFVIVTDKGDSANVRIDRVSANSFENPNPRLLKVADSGKLSKEQALFDIDALIYGLSQIHPDIFSVCRQIDFFRVLNDVKKSLPDSVTPVQLYKAAAPVVAMIGDGHTSLSFPAKSMFTPEYKRFPVYVDVLPDRSIVCTSSLDSIIGRGDRIVSVNNVSADSIIDSMMHYVSGERTHFKLTRIDVLFNRLFHMLYEADSYEVAYMPKGSKKVLKHTFPATLFSEIKKRCPTTKTGKKYEDYSYIADSLNNVAVMDFRSFSDKDRMKQFADSMFADLKNKNITNLIIDIRNNGGGNSGVGDILLRYISPEPFVQMDKGIARVTPLSAKLIGRDIDPVFSFWEADTSDFIKPRTAEEGHYSGKVYLLISNRTFSSAGSFSWAFKECRMGSVIGEESGGMNVAYGDILPYQLPVSKMKVYVSFKRFWQLRADENDIHGTIPDIEVPAEKALAEAMKLVRKNKRKK